MIINKISKVECLNVKNKLLKLQILQGSKNMKRLKINCTFWKT